MKTSASTEADLQTDSIIQNPVRTKDFVASSNEKAILRTWLIFALFLPLVCMLPLLFAQSIRLVSQPAFLFFPLSTALGIAFLVWTGAYRPAGYQRARISELLLIIGVGFYVVGVVWYSPLIVQFAAVVVILGWACGAYGGSSLTRIVAICTLFAVTLPLPGGFDSRIGSWLQSVSAWACNGFLDAISIPNILEGNAFQVGANKLSLSGVCNGADSLNALVAASLAVLVFRRSTLLVGVLTVATVPLVLVVGNMLRLLAIAIGMEYFGVSLFTGTGLVIIAIFVFGADLACMLLFHFAIAALVEPIPDLRSKNNLTQWFIQIASWPKEEPSRLNPSMAASGNSIAAGEKSWSPSVVAIGIWCVLCVVFGSLSAFVAIFRDGNSDVFPGFSPEIAAAFPSNDAFPTEFNGIRKIGFDADATLENNSEGRISHRWKFDNRGNQIFVSLDFPFLGRRQLSQGFQAFGWRILDTKETEHLTASGQTIAVDELKMQNQYGLLGFVWYGFFDENGAPMDRSVESTQLSRRNIFSMLKTDRDERLPVSYQVQALFESGQELSEAELDRNRKLFFEIFERVRQASEIPLQKAKQAQN